ncbi:MAG: Fmu (Sun) domain-containing protein [Chitinophagaceae bacterium]
MKYFSHLNTAQTILTRYQGAQPFHHFIREFFRQHKKYGSKDRKSIARLCYSCLRLGYAARHLPLQQQILTGLFLTSTTADEVCLQLIPEWSDSIMLSLNEKLEFLQLKSAAVFPWQSQLSKGIEATAFAESMLTQPDLFLRIRPGYEEKIRRQLTQAGFVFREMSSNCVALDNTVKADEHLQVDKEVVIQDYSSQQVGGLLQLIPRGAVTQVWDCCAASGGKSILAYDLMPDITLTVSDIRESILANLRKRFAAAGITQYELFRADMSVARVRPPLSAYDLVIADVPCSGSGTWSRTPEQLYYFDEKKITEYASLQRKILNQAIHFVKPGGYFLYITCSVFSAENEIQTTWLCESGFEVVQQQLFAGYQFRADTLFGSLLRKQL